MTEYEKEQIEWNLWDNYQRLEDCFKYHSIIFNAQIFKIFKSIGYIIDVSADGTINFYDGKAQLTLNPQPCYSFNPCFYENPSEYPQEIKQNLISLIKQSEQDNFVKAINYSIADLFCGMVIAEVSKRKGAKCDK